MLINSYAIGFMVIHPLVVISFNKTLPRLKANAVESANPRASCSCYTCWVRVCTHTCLSTLLFCFGYLRLLLSARQRGGLRPCGAQLFMYLFYASATLEPILDSVVIQIIHFIDSFTIYINVIRDMCCDILMICCIYAWLDPGAYMIARFMFL
jgi:hypothetical protein